MSAWTLHIRRVNSYSEIRIRTMDDVQEFLLQDEWLVGDCSGYEKRAGLDSHISRLLRDIQALLPADDSNQANGFRHHLGHAKGHLDWLKKFELRTVEVRAHSAKWAVVDYGFARRDEGTTFSEFVEGKPAKVYVALDQRDDGGSLTVTRGESVAAIRSFSFGEERRPAGVYDSLRFRVDADWDEREYT